MKSMDLVGKRIPRDLIKLPLPHHTHIHTHLNQLVPQRHIFASSEILKRCELMTWGLLKLGTASRRTQALNQRLTVSRKDQIINISGFVGPTVSDMTAHSRHRSGRAALDRMGVVLSNKTLLTKASSDLNLDQGLYFADPSSKQFLFMSLLQGEEKRVRKGKPYCERTKSSL